MNTKEQLMKLYAKVCGYNDVPFHWTADDYSVSGWKELIHKAYGLQLEQVFLDRRIK